jgi:hypothetical protein
MKPLPPDIQELVDYEATVPVLIANIQRLRAVNAKLLAALEECYRVLSTGSYHAAPATAQARAVIEEATK